MIDRSWKRETKIRERNSKTGEKEIKKETRRGE